MIKKFWKCLCQMTSLATVFLMPQDVESRVITSIEEAESFAIQLDESTDITGKAQIFILIRFVHEEDLTEQFIFCKPLPETTRGHDIYEVVNIYFSSNGSQWKSCISICMDDAPPMPGSIKGFVAVAKQKYITLFLRIVSCTERHSYQNE